MKDYNVSLEDVIIEIKDKKYKQNDKFSLILSYIGILFFTIIGWMDLL